MRRIHIVGRKNHGKTTLILQLVREFSRLGYRVGTVKHTRHHHELDRPGSDSQRHRAAGAGPAAIVTGHATGVFFANGLSADPYAPLAPLYADCDIVIVEGDIGARAPKIEVWRAVVGTAPLAAERSDIALMVTDDAPPSAIATLRRDQLMELLEEISRLTHTSTDRASARARGSGAPGRS
jgi:molybdopterin-guanine dinucleotide biosynthesis protein B